VSEYHVILEDLEQAYLAFYREERVLDAQRSKVDSPAPDCGGAKVNGALRNALDVVTTLYTLLTKNVEEHGDKMKTAHDGYTRDNDDVLNLFNTLEG
jgi:hypothetical protein